MPRRRRLQHRVGVALGSLADREFAPVPVLGVLEPGRGSGIAAQRARVASP
jgi:hypothetical protein